MNGSFCSLKAEAQNKYNDGSNNGSNDQSDDDVIKICHRIVTNVKEHSGLARGAGGKAVGVGDSSVQTTDKNRRRPACIGAEEVKHYGQSLADNVPDGTQDQKGQSTHDQEGQHGNKDQIDRLVSASDKM